ncbi:MAG: polysaccharide biosynthesis protein [Ruminococcaceae bacterium]|nr:polysaccharide biosynthesis protein [Oscillospiraceae bacterium]
MEEKLSIKKRTFRNRYFFLLDFLCSFIAYFVSYGMAEHFSTADKFMFSHLFQVVGTGILFCLILYYSRIYFIMWMYSGTKDYIRLIFCCITASMLSLILHLAFYHGSVLKISILAVILISVWVVGSRMSLRAWHRIDRDRNLLSEEYPKKRLLIVGAGESAAMVLRDMEWNGKLNYDVVGFVDDDPEKRHARVHGFDVLGDRDSIPRICRLSKVQEILIAIPSASAADRKEIIEICNETNCKVKILPSIGQMLDHSLETVGKARDVQIEDLLAREPIQLENEEISEYIYNQVVIVTGGGGSIGSELCRQIMKFSPKKLVVLDIYENNAYELQMELNQTYPNNNIDIIIASVRDMQRLEVIFAEYRPNIVFHAAAHKHVPLMEYSPGEAIKNNVFGTLNVAKCADKFGVRRFVLISTDKAVNPTNIMGATKRICEMLVQCMQQSSDTQFVMVRFGNVLGSNGSVIPLFKKQIQAGGPVTVTDKRITRFFMTIPEAAQLVLQAAAYAKGGEIFVLDMGEPVRIYDLAKNLIKLSGYQPEVDIKIEFCGLRPGEKLYEELLMDEEGLTNTNHQKIFIGKPFDIDSNQLNTMLNELEKASESDDPEYIKDVVGKFVPTYVRNSN